MFEYGKVFDAPVAEIINQWIPGDYSEYDCACEGFYHTCNNESLRMFNGVFIDIRKDFHYEALFKDIAHKGYNHPISAVHDKGNIVLIDGHHRLCIAFDMGLKRIPAYIAQPGTDIEELVLWDSQRWE